MRSHILQASGTYLITLNLYAAIIGSVSADNHFGSWRSCWACVYLHNHNNNTHNNKNNNKLLQQQQQQQQQQQHSNTQTTKHTTKLTNNNNNNTLQLLGSH
jgi:hypothetical protein